MIPRYTKDCIVTILFMFLYDLIPTSLLTAIRGWKKF